MIKIRRGRIARVATTILALTLVLGACGRGEAGSSSGKQYVAMSFASGDVQTWNEQLKIMKTKIEAAGYGFLSDNPQNNAENQVRDWQAWIERGDVKAIMGFPVQADALVPVTQQAKDAGIQVISYASTWKGASPGLTVDDFSVAKNVATDAGNFINENLGGQATVGVLTDRSTDLGRKRADGMIEGLKETAAKAEIKEIGIQLTRRSAYAAASSQIAANPHTQVWLALSDDPALGIYQALLDSGVAKDDPDYFLGSVDGQQEALHAVAVPNSIYRSAYVVPSETSAELNIRAFLAALQDEPVRPEIAVFTKVTADNVAKYLD